MKETANQGGRSYLPLQKSTRSTRGESLRGDSFYSYTRRGKSSSGFPRIPFGSACEFLRGFRYFNFADRQNPRPREFGAALGSRLLWAHPGSPMMRRNCHRPVRTEKQHEPQEGGNPAGRISKLTPNPVRLHPIPWVIANQERSQPRFRESIAHSEPEGHASRTRPLVAESSAESIEAFQLRDRHLALSLQPGPCYTFAQLLAGAKAALSGPQSVSRIATLNEYQNRPAPARTPLFWSHP